MSDSILEGKTMNETYLARMRDMLKDEYPAYLSCLEQPARKGMRINTLRTDEETFFHDMPIAHEPSPFSDNGFYVDGQKLGNTPEYFSGLFYMQEPSASSAVTVLDPKPGMKVLDLCAAPGSKSTQIAEKLQNTGFLCVNEINSSRSRILLENIVKHGTANTLVLNSEPKTVADAFTEYFDAVLCDAPCSGEGMFRKSDDAVEQWSLNNVLMCAERQRGILDEAYRALRPGGILVYSTCTFSMEENEETIAYFLQQHPDMHVERPAVDFGRPAFAVTSETAKAIRIFPMDHGEGHFICRMRKDGDAYGNVKEMKSQPIPKVADEFLRDNLLRQYPHYLFKADKLYGGTAPFLDCGKNRILSWQIKLGEVKNGRFEPSHAFFLSSYAPCVNTVELTTEEAEKYIHGETLMKPCPKGWYAVTLHGHAIGGVHSDGKMLKNKFPKSLRIR